MIVVTAAEDPGQKPDGPMGLFPAVVTFILLPILQLNFFYEGGCYYSCWRQGRLSPH